MISPLQVSAPALLAWRLDDDRFQKSWDSGEGAYLFGGRWNPKGQRVVYCALDASTAILEVAVHKGFRTLDTVPHVMTAMAVLNRADVRFVEPSDLPNPNWLAPGVPSAGQQAFGGDLLKANCFVAFPSAVSPNCWNLLFDPAVAKGRYEQLVQERYALDPRLHPPA